MALGACAEGRAAGRCAAALPKPGNKDKCAANMAWELKPLPKPEHTLTPANNSGGGGGGGDAYTIAAAWDSSLCFETGASASLGTCDSAVRAQQWVLSGAPGSQQLHSGGGFGCLSYGEPAGR